MNDLWIYILIFSASVVLLALLLIVEPLCSCKADNKRIKKLINEHGPIIKAKVITRFFDEWEYSFCVHKYIFEDSDIKVENISGWSNRYTFTTKKESQTIDNITYLKFIFKDNTIETLIAPAHDVKDRLREIYPEEF